MQFLWEHGRVKGNMKKNLCITIANGVCIKTVDPATMRIEVEKTVRARAIAASSGIFEVPEILDCDAKSGRITFELMRDIHPLRDAATSEHTAMPLMRTLGRALAIIHKNLTMPEDMILPLPNEYAMPSAEVFLHGDFGPGNIFVGSDGKRIVILDWQSSAKLGSPATYGSRYFDLSWLIYDLFYRPVNRPRYRMAVPAAQLAEEFLRGYLEISDFGPDNRLKEYMQQFLRQKIIARKKGWHLKRRLLLIPSHFKLRKFISYLDDKLTFEESAPNE